VLLAISLFFYSKGYVLELMTIQCRLDRTETAKIIRWLVWMPG